MKSKQIKKIKKSFLFGLIVALFKFTLVVLILFFIAVVFLSRSQGVFGLRSFVISTGSMGEIMPASSFVITQSQDSYQIGDIITFYTNDQNGNRQSMPTTHRIVTIKEGKNLGYQTKGDANQTSGGFVTPAKSVIGKVVVTLPYFGYLTNFINTNIGRIVFVVVPASILAYFQVIQILLEIKKLKSKKVKIHYPNIFPIVLFVFLLIPRQVKAFFDDEEIVLNNQISAAVLDMQVNQTQPLTPINQTYQSLLSVQNINSTDPFLYMISASLTGGPVLCLDSNIIITADSNQVFNDTLANLNLFQHSQLSVTNQQQLIFDVSFSDTSVDQVCSFDFNFFAWHQGSLPNQSFTDLETISDSFTLTSGTIQTNITLTQFNQTLSPLDITYNSIGAAKVNLCYSFNLDSWICDDQYTDYPNSPGSIPFDFPQGNGVYYFITYGYTALGFKEDKSLPDPLSLNPLDPAVHALTKTNPDISINFTYDNTTNEINLLFSLIPPEFGQNVLDFLEYEIIYNTPFGQKGGEGQIFSDHISPQFTYQPNPYYLGTCTSPDENCTPDQIIDNKTTIRLTGQIAGQYIYINNMFSI